MSEIKFTYFNARGLGEVTRLLFKYAGIDFIDDRFEDEDWPKIKPNTPFGQTPILTVNGKTANQSTAIARYAAKQAKLVGSNDWENLEIDAIVDTINDFRIKIQQYYYEPDAAIKESRKGPLFQETIPFYMGKFEEVAKKNDGYLAVGKLTWADFALAGTIEYLNHISGKDLLEKCPNLKKVVQNVTSIPAVKAWIDVRPKTED
ncbi:glutathione s-transferase [Holotrichia oblita]|uniref:Glutathione s-transferase n=1 Tax=Holotrichia oblita TaxID=644536 RepID=A0ACB9TXC0_HOLOL|nr:glutathione s-transferase [Holotrichia oblita]